ncbi:unnamed protein product [Ectocarpus sp. CCAP 1310/34]|nr:unnamed protein product [Ectocarpus sp. CCAP 1310/34]
MSSGKVELLGDNVEILDYEPEGEAPTAEQFPAAGAGDKSRPMPIVFTVDNLLANIATADPAELEPAYNTGRTSLEDIVVAARLSSDFPLFVSPFSLPPEEKLLLLPHDEFMAYQALNEMWYNGLAKKVADAEAREKAEREDAEQKEEREAARAAAARKQAEEREAARAAAARKQAEERKPARAAAARKQEAERAAALAEREAYLQAARAKHGALRSRLEDLEPLHQDPRAAALPSPYPRRSIIVPPQSQSQVPLGSRSTASLHEKEREVAATPTNEEGREGAATPEFSVTLGLPVAAEDGASFATAITVYEFHVDDTAFLSRPLEMPAEEMEDSSCLLPVLPPTTISSTTYKSPGRPLHALHMFLVGTRITVGRRLRCPRAGRTVGVTKIRRPRAGRTTTAAPPSLREGAAPEMAGEGKPWGTSLRGLRRRAATVGAGVGAQNGDSAPILRLGVGAAGAETVVGEAHAFD